MDENLQQRIEDYLGGQLPPEAATEFEQQIAKDSELAKEVALYRQMEDLLGESDVTDFKQTLNSVMDNVENHKEVKTAKMAKIRSLDTANEGRRWWAMAAGFALVALLGTVLLLQSNEASPDTLYADHIALPDALGAGGSLRSTETPATTTPSTDLNQQRSQWRQAANLAYQRQDYATALQQLEKIEQSDSNFDPMEASDFFFKKGLVQLQLGQYQSAITSFEAVEAGDYVSNAQWKRALALLKVDLTKAKDALQTIIDNNHLDKETAEAILEKL
ncbi:MAG: hypothetical protein AAF960_13310 [Bacteroidota bacterium]